MLCRVYVGQSLGIDLGPDSNARVHIFHEVVQHLGHIVELLVAGNLVKDLRCLVEAQPYPGVPTPFQNPLVDSQDQWSTLGGAFDPDKLAGLDVHRIVHQDASYCFNAWVCHIPLLQTV